MSKAPHAFKELLEAIDNKMFMLQATWKIYRQLYGTSQERLDLLNTWVPDYTGIVQRVLWDSVIVGICRLCDPPVQLGNKNLTLKRLIDSLDPAPDAAQAAYFDAQLAKVKALAKALHKHRHKRLAHSDLKNAMSVADTLPGISRQTIEDVLAAVRELLNRINLDYFKNEVAYEHVHLRGDGDDLINCLQMTQRFSDLQDEAYGNSTPQQIVTKLADRMYPRL
jgi:hypothetical protein